MFALFRILHLNNARYLKYLHRTRLEHLLATGLLWNMLNPRSRAAALSNMGIAATSPPLPEPLLRWRAMRAAKREFARQGA